jgi:uncharacterized protein YjbJ (UPF0337 family)
LLSLSFLFSIPTQLNQTSSSSIKPSLKPKPTKNQNQNQNNTAQKPTMSSSSSDRQDQPPSTLKSYMDSATGTVQDVVGYLTGIPLSFPFSAYLSTNPAKPGNPADKQAATDKHQSAAASYNASHAGASAGPLDFSASGVTGTNPDRSGGKKDQTMGSAKEFLGNLTGNAELKREGRRQNDEGQGREAVGQLKDYVGGAADRVLGTVGSGLAETTGDEQKKKEFERQHDAGKTNVRGVEADVQKQ